ncbi:Developmental regulator flbA [Fusarium oxysporum f. sp. albedinis]|nr:Developmental regulator flbA [Fusarium oxysporum f. sp. albedinis]
MKFATALFATASAITLASAAPSMSDEQISNVPRDLLFPRQACRGTNCSGCQNGRKCCILRDYPFCCNC